MAVLSGARRPPRGDALPRGRDFRRGQEPIASLIECTLETGRTHQVRVHLAYIGTR